MLKYAAFDYSLEEAANEFFGMICGSDETKELSDFGVEPEQLLAVACYLAKHSIAYTANNVNKFNLLLKSHDFQIGFAPDKLGQYYDFLYSKHNAFINELSTNTAYTGGAFFSHHSTTTVNIDCEGGFMQHSPPPDQKSEKEVAEFAYEKITQTLTEANEIFAHIRLLENLLNVVGKSEKLVSMMKAEILDAKYKLYKLTSQL